MEIKTKNTKLVKKLRKLKWDTSAKIYKKHLPGGETLPVNFYQSVKLINTLTIIGNYIYKYLPNDSDDKLFLEYFIANAYESEEFIWNQRGLMQSYYYEGLKWQRGTIINPNLDYQSIFPILSSAVVDSIIALILKYTKEPNIILWLGQEQQNYASTELLCEEWLYPIDTYSNPYVFKNKDKNFSKINAHRLVFGPSTWLAMTADVIIWMKESNKNKFNNYIIKGKHIWQQIDKYIYINEQILDLIPNDIKLEKKIFTFGIINSLSEYILSILNNPNKNVKRLIELLDNNRVYNIYTKTLDHLTLDKAENTLNNINNSLKHAINSSNNEDYISNINIAGNHIKYFYCGHNCKKSVFIDPTVVCV